MSYISVDHISGGARDVLLDGMYTDLELFGAICIK